MALGVHGSTVGLPVLVPCQEVMAITAGEQDPPEKGAKMRQQECGEEKSGFYTTSQAAVVTCAWHVSVLRGRCLL